MISSALIVKKFNKNHELKHRTIKKLEHWNSGIMEYWEKRKEQKEEEWDLACIFAHHSNIPTFQICFINRHSTPMGLVSKLYATRPSNLNTINFKWL
jgi:hypothetical protein